MWTALIGAFTWFVASGWPKIIGIVLTTFFITSYGVHISMIYSPSYRTWVWKRIVEVESKDNSDAGQSRRERILSDVRELVEKTK